jgi:hypothetical protein
VPDNAKARAPTVVAYLLAQSSSTSEVQIVRLAGPPRQYLRDQKKTARIAACPRILAMLSIAQLDEAWLQDRLTYEEQRISGQCQRVRGRRRIFSI